MLLVVFQTIAATHMLTTQHLQWFCVTLFHWGYLPFTWKIYWGFKFHFGQFDQSEICTEVSFPPLKVMWTLLMNLTHTEVKFYPEVKYETGLSSLRVSCKHALIKGYTDEDLYKVISFFNYKLLKSFSISSDKSERKSNIHIFCRYSL